VKGFLDPRERILDIHSRLADFYPTTYSGLLEPKRGNPVDVLVATILSQATNDTLSDRAFHALKRAFASWDDVIDAEPSSVEAALVAGGLQKEKTKKIQSALSKLRNDFGTVTLKPLEDKTSEECFDYLVSLPGVGPKTAACVMVFGLGKPAFPVDTHVFRVSKRLGLVPEKANAVKAQELLEEHTPDELKLPLHLLMIRHGRALCASRKPKCSGCPLNHLCEGDPSPKENP
jgi:endonuclease-3